MDIEKRRAYQREWYRKNKPKFQRWRKDYYESRKAEYAERSKKWYSSEENKMRLRESKLGVNFQELVERQGNRCGICGTEFTDYSKVHIDHDHDTGFVRGLLCREHNRGLGFFNDDYELLEKAAKWIFEGKVRYLNGD